MEMETETKRRRLIEDDSAFLPPEIITEILYRLPADSAIGCRVICKQWRSLIDHPSFRDTHTHQLISSTTSNPKQFGNSSSSFGFFLCACAVKVNRRFHLRFVKYIDHGEELVPEFKPCKPITHNPFSFYNNINNWATLLISSCNGLVFMGSTKANYIKDMFLCNPFTREYLRIVPAEERQMRLKRKAFMAYGFGYLPSTNEYKIVSIYYHDLNGAKGEVSVYTIGRGRWRNKGEIPYWLYNEFHPGVLANGAIHWFTNTVKQKIVSFDLAEEKFKVALPLPPRAPSSNYLDHLGVLGGCLCVTRSDKTIRESPKDIWVLNVHTKVEGEKEFSWNRRFSIPWKGTFCRAKPNVILKSGKILLCGGTGLFSYDPKTGAFNEYRHSIFCDPRLKVIPYTKSFVSLKALGEEDAKRFEGFVSLAPSQLPQQ